MAARVMRAIGASANRPSEIAGSTSCASDARKTAPVAGDQRIDGVGAGDARRRRVRRSRSAGPAAAAPSRAGSRRRRPAAGRRRRSETRRRRVTRRAAGMVDGPVEAGSPPSTPMRDGDADCEQQRERGQFERRRQAFDQIGQHRLTGGQRAAEIATQQVADVIERIAPAGGRSSPSFARIVAIESAFAAGPAK